MNKQQLANEIWEAANSMRSKIEANEYKDYILGFIFYNYLSNNQEKFVQNEGFLADIDKSLISEKALDPKDQKSKECSDEDKETIKEIIKYIRSSIGYFISFEHLFSTWLNEATNFDVSNVRDALAAFDRNIHPNFNSVYKGVLTQLQNGLSKLGESSGAQTKAIRRIFGTIKKIPMDGKQDYDVLGFIYEYLISMFAANAGKKAGEFYTPHEVSLLMSEIIANHLKDCNEMDIYDPTSGSGSLLINIGKCITKYNGNPNSIKYYAQELKESTYNLTRMNLIMRGILPSNLKIRNADTLEEDWPDFDENDPEHTYKPHYFDAVVSNPPYSQVWEPNGKESDPRYKDFGLAPKSKADYAFLLHDLYHLKPTGMMTIVLPHGVLFRGGEEGRIRQNLIERNHIHAIIGLPANIFYGTGIPTIIMVLVQQRKEEDVLIIDASKGFEKVGKNNKLRACDIKKIVDTIKSRATIDKFSKLVSKEEIRKNDYNLNIPRYVDSSENAESWDLYSLMFGGVPAQEINELNAYWEGLPNLKEVIFNFESQDQATINDNVEDILNNHESVKNFLNSYSDAFFDFKAYLKNELINNVNDVVVSKEIDILSDDIFRRLKNIPLVDKYEAYQLLYDDWSIIETDIEMIQTDGFQCTKCVDPNVVIKKKDGISDEVQDGFKGRIIPFELVQKTLLKADLDGLEKIKNDVEDIDAKINEAFESLKDIDVISSILTLEGESFDFKVISNEAKKIKKALSSKNSKLVVKELSLEDLIEKFEKLNEQTDVDEDSLQKSLILEIDRLTTQKKSLKKLYDNKFYELQDKTKVTIENLTDEQVIDLLQMKWIDPLLDNLNTLPKTITKTLLDKITTLSKKYEDTLLSLEEEIQTSEKELSSLIDELTGDERDMKGLKKFQELLGGLNND